jgi:hypothetical protein
MITNHTTRTGKNDRIGGATGSSRPMAVGVRLAVVSALLIAAVLLASRAGVLPISFSISDGTGAQPAAFGIEGQLSGAGSAYNGSAYVQYLLAGPFAQTPISRTGSAYDGSAYVQYLLASPSAEPAEPVATNPNIPISGTGSAYNGGN